MPLLAYEKIIILSNMDITLKIIYLCNLMSLNIKINIYYLKHIYHYK